MPDEPIRTEGRLIQRRLLWIMLIGTAGTAGELMLLEHTESAWQWSPVVALVAGFFACIVVLFSESKAASGVLRLLMATFLLLGTVGLFQHYKGNVEFELEMYPTRGGLELFWESLKGATPTMAPGAMILLGLVGLVAFTRPAKGPDGNESGQG